MEQDRYEAGQSAGRTRQLTPRVVRGASTLVAVLGVEIAALIFDPATTANPFTAPRSIGYFLVAGVIGLAMARLRSHAPESESTNRLAEISGALLITGSAALFLKGRVTVLPLLALIVIAAIIAAVDVYPSGVSPNVGLVESRLVVLALLWLALVGVASIEASAHVTLPVLGIVLVAGAASIFWTPDRRSRDLIVSIASVVAVGTEIAFALQFVRATPFGTASLWLLGATIVMFRFDRQLRIGAQA